MTTHTVVASWAAGSNELHAEWVMRAIREVTGGADLRSYVGFLGEEGPDGVAAYPEPHWTRLRQVKRRYDPENFFGGNQNVAPAG